jgi:hypothetical protein
MVEKISNFLLESLGAELNASEIEGLKANIETTFTNLKTASSNGWASFSSSSNSKNSSWEYRVLFAFPNPDLPTDFYSLVTTIKLEANITEETSWWGLSSSTSKNFSAAVTSAQLVITKGFKDPGA